MAEISRIVSVTTSVRAAGVTTRDFGRTLFITDDDTLAARGAYRFRVYPSATAVAEDFASTSEVVKAANVYFAQSPAPRPLVVARFSSSDAAHRFVGGESTKTEADLLEGLQAITAGELDLGGGAVSTINLSGASDLGGVATALQAALRGGANSALDNAVVTYASRQFTITVPYSTTYTPMLPTGDLAEALFLSTDLGGLLFEGGAGELIADALTGIEQADSSWHFVTLQASLETSANSLAVAEWVEARQYMYSAGESGAAALVPNEETSVGAQLHALKRQKTFVTWSGTAGDYKPLAVAGTAGTVNYEGSNTIKTLKFKSLSGVTADNLSATELGELERKRVNSYVPYAGEGIFAEGTCAAPGVWIDVRQFLNWFQNAVQSETFSLLNASPRVPQTEPGIATLRNVIDTVCQRAVRNGAIAHGVVSEGLRSQIGAVFGDDTFEATLSRGYIIHIGDLAEQSSADRSARKSPPVQVFLKGSGAIHSVEIAVTFEN